MAERNPADGFIEYMSPQKIADIKAEKPQEKGDYNPTISPIFKSRSGKSYVSLLIGPEQFDALQKIEVGGKLVIKIRDLQQADNRGAPPTRRAAPAPRPKAAKDDVSDL